MPALPRLPLVLALPFALLAGCDFDHSTHQQTLEFDDPEILALALASGAGDITIVGDPEATSIHVVARIHGHSTELRQRIVEGVLELGVDCPADAWTCAVDWTITVPADLPADLSTGSGDIEASDLSGKLRLDTGSGDVVLTDIASPTLAVETGSGDVEGDAIACEDFEGSAGSGDLDLRSSARPRRLVWTSGSGDVELTLPSGRYDLAIETGSGDVDLDRIADDPDADALLSLTTGSGDVSIHGQ